MSLLGKKTLELLFFFFKKKIKKLIYEIEKWKPYSETKEVFFAKPKIFSV
jgi:hypothetical protein